MRAHRLQTQHRAAQMLKVAVVLLAHLGPSQASLCDNEENKTACMAGCEAMASESGSGEYVFDPDGYAGPYCRTFFNTMQSDSTGQDLMCCIYDKGGVASAGTGTLAFCPDGVNVSWPGGPPDDGTSVCNQYCTLSSCEDGNWVDTIFGKEKRCSTFWFGDKGTKIASGASACPPPPPPPPAIPVSGDNPCFAADTTTACKLVGDATPAEARRQCYDEAEGTDAALVLMKTLAAGDVVLAADASGALSLSRVVVNQHKANPLASALLEVHHSAGVLSLTPDHFLLIDGAFAPARDAKPGSALTLADGADAVVERVATAHGTVINPVTSSGTIVADGVVAATHPEWSAGFMLASEVPLPLFYAAAAAFPATTQAYYDAVLEPLFDALGANIVKPAALGASALVVPFFAADAAAALGLAAFAGAAPVALLVLGAAALRSRKAQ